MQMVNDMAVEMHDPRWKRRRDYTIEDKILIDQIKLRMGRRASLMMQKAFQFKLSRMERHLQLRAIWLQTAVTLVRIGTIR